MESEVTSRTEESHEHIFELIATSGPLVEFYKTNYGVNRFSILNTLDYAHVCDQLLPPDIMHDILEGYLPYTFKQLVSSLETFGVSAATINECINTFEFGPGNKPSPISVTHLKSKEGTHLGQSG